MDAVSVRPPPVTAHDRKRLRLREHGLIHTDHHQRENAETLSSPSIQTEKPSLAPAGFRRLGAHAIRRQKGWVEQSSSTLPP